MRGVLISHRVLLLWLQSSRSHICCKNVPLDLICGPIEMCTNYTPSLLLRGPFLKIGQFADFPEVERLHDLRGDIYSVKNKCEHILLLY